jgi:hypothetical protein
MRAAHARVVARDSPSVELLTTWRRPSRRPAFRPCSTAASERCSCAVQVLDETPRFLSRDANDLAGHQPYNIFISRLGAWTLCSWRSALQSRVSGGRFVEQALVPSQLILHSRCSLHVKAGLLYAWTPAQLRRKAWNVLNTNMKLCARKD